MKNLSRNSIRCHRKRRIRAKVKGTSNRPRVSVFRSLRDIYVQVIDDTTGRTLCAVSLNDVAKKSQKNNLEGAVAIGKIVAKKCQAQNIKEVVFDRSGYKYHGKIAAIAKTIRENGVTM